MQNTCETCVYFMRYQGEKGICYESPPQLIVRDVGSPYSWRPEVCSDDLACCEYCKREEEEEEEEEE